MCFGVWKSGIGLNKLLLFFDVDDPVRKAWDKADVNCVLCLDEGSWQAVAESIWCLCEVQGC